MALWLRRVFWVMGGYVATTGVLVLYVANTGLRAGDAGALGALALASATSLGWMDAVNFMLGSDDADLSGRLDEGRCSAERDHPALAEGEGSHQDERDRGQADSAGE